MRNVAKQELSNMLNIALFKKAENFVFSYARHDPYVIMHNILVEYLEEYRWIKKTGYKLTNGEIHSILLTLISSHNNAEVKEDIILFVDEIINDGFNVDLALFEASRWHNGYQTWIIDHLLARQCASPA